MSKELRLAIYKGDAEAVMRLVRQDNVNEAGPGGLTPMHIAVLMGRLDLVKILYSKGARIDAKDEKGIMPLTIAAFDPNTEIHKISLFLIDTAKDSTTRKKEFLEASDALNDKSNDKIVLTILNGEYKKFAAEAKAQDLEVAAAQSSALSVPSQQLLETLQLAYVNGDKNIFEDVRRLIAAGADVNVFYPKSGATVLMMAVYLGQIDVVKLLVERGAIIDKKMAEGITALGIARGDIEKYLEEQLEKQKAVAAKSKVTKEEIALTTLISAAKSNNVRDIESALHAAPRAINLQDEDGMTPLMHAVKQKNVIAIRTLIDEGADVNLINKKGEHVGMIAADGAQARDAENISRLLLELIQKKSGPIAAHKYQMYYQTANMLRNDRVSSPREVSSSPRAPHVSSSTRLASQDAKDKSQ